MSETVGALRRQVACLFAEAVIDNPDLDARLLVGHALALDHLALMREAERSVSDDDRDLALALAARRIGGVPVARLIGHKEFWGLSLRVTDATLVPRPDTETVVQTALETIRAGRPDPRIVDLGTGPGTLLLALLHERPAAVGIGTDLSLPALAVARDNARRHNLDRRAAFVCGDFGSSLIGGFNLVVSNPPYIERGAIPTLPRDVQSDPWLALDGGADGLDAYRAIAADARRLLAPGGVLVLELGAGQEESVTDVLLRSGLGVDGPARRDLGGIPRALTARLPC